MKSEPESKTVDIRVSLPDELHRKVKARAALESKTILELVQAALALYVAKSESRR